MRDRGGDVGQLDRVGLRLERELAERAEVVRDLLLRRQAVAKVRDDAAGDGDVRLLDRHTERLREAADDRQERVCREVRGLIRLRVDDRGAQSRRRALDLARRQPACLPPAAPFQSRSQ